MVNNPSEKIPGEELELNHQTKDCGALHCTSSLLIPMNAMIINLTYSH